MLEDDGKLELGESEATMLRAGVIETKKSGHVRHV
jgi:hypothetical protein